MLNSVLYFFGSLIIGFVAAYAFGSTATDGQPKLGFNLIVYVRGNYCMHIHHWMYLVPLAIYTALIVLAECRRVKGLITLSLIGFMLGLSLYDIFYSDWDKTKVKCSSTYGQGQEEEEGREVKVTF